MKSLILVAVLVGGLVIGAGLTYVAVPHSVTTTQTSTIFSATTRLSTVTSTKTQFLSTTQTQIQATTQIQTDTVTQSVTTTATSTVTQLSTLVSFSGSGDSTSPPFTATTVNVQVNYSITATEGCAEGQQGCTGVAFTWYILLEGSSASTCSGNVSSVQGTFTDYCTGLTVGVNYEVQVSATNCNWQLSVTKSD